MEKSWLERYVQGAQASIDFPHVPLDRRLPASVAKSSGHTTPSLVPWPNGNWWLPNRPRGDWTRLVFTLAKGEQNSHKVEISC